MFEQVKKTYLALGILMSKKPTLPTEEELFFRMRFIEEEQAELQFAFEQSDVVGMADAVADLIIVAAGLAAIMGLPLEAVLEVVNQANLEGKVKVNSAQESKRGYINDLRKTTQFVSPEAKIKELLEKCK